MNKSNYKEWAKAAGIRAVKTFAQGLVTLIGADQINIINIDWLNILGIAATMALLSLLTSVAGLPEVESEV